MTQAERDRLVSLKKAKKKLITQQEAAEELGITERHVRRLLHQLKKRGDKAVVHALRGMPSNRKFEETERSRAVGILSQAVYRGFGPTLATEYLNDKHDMEVGRETVRQWMIGAKLWRAQRQRVEKIHPWRTRRSRFGDLMQWDTSIHAWLEGREEMVLINMIADATSQWLARMNVLERYLQKRGRPLAFYTDKAAIFRTAEKTKRGQSAAVKDRADFPRLRTGQGHACSRHHDDGASQSRSGNRVSAMVQQDYSGCARQCRMKLTSRWRSTTS